MRIVYDDKKAGDVADLLQRFVYEGLDAKAATEYDYGMNRIQRRHIIAQLGRFLEKYGFQIGKRATHAYGLGNNAQLPIFYNDGDEMQECCYFNCNIDPFGVCYMSIEDYNGRRISGAYEVYAKR